MKKFTYYTIVKHFNLTWEGRFYDALTWARNVLYYIPIFVQIDIEFTTPRATNMWFPELAIGRNYGQDKINDFHHFKVWSIWFDWLGLFIGAGVCIKCKKQGDAA